MLSWVMWDETYWSETFCRELFQMKVNTSERLPSCTHTPCRKEMKHLSSLWSRELRQSVQDQPSLNNLLNKPLNLLQSNASKTSFLNLIRRSGMSSLKSPLINFPLESNGTMLLSLLLVCSPSVQGLPYVPKWAKRAGCISQGELEEPPHMPPNHWWHLQSSL